MIKYKIFIKSITSGITVLEGVVTEGELKLIQEDTDKEKYSIEVVTLSAQM